MPLTLTRRTFTLSAASSAALTALPNIGLTAEIASVTVGDATVSMLSDGYFELPTAFFTGAEDAALQAAGNPIEIGATVWLIRTGTRTILVDTGSGQALSAMFPTVGKLDALLAADGINKADVTDIVLTHMHADHIGGLADPDAGGFSNATIHVSADEWAFWTNPELRNAVPQADQPMIDLLQSIAGPVADRVIPHAGETDLGDGLTLVPLAGHTPGHSGVRITGQGDDSLFLIGDAIISGALQFENPNVHYALDADPDQAAATRIAVLNALADSGALFSATHLAYPGTGRVTRSGDGFAFAPLT